MKFSPFLKKVTSVSAASMLGLSLATFAPATAAPVHDGSSRANAAASCWEVKQVNPQAKSGTYWLNPPQLPNGPAQFYCDQESDGGGWVLLGRGREGWNRSGGQGDVNNLWRNPTGAGSNTPVQLTPATIDALLGGKPAGVHGDGIRIRRALNEQGTQFQESYGKFNSTQMWTWNIQSSKYWDSVNYREDPAWKAPSTATDPNRTRKDSKGNDTSYRAVNPIFTGPNDGFAFGYGRNVPAPANQNGSLGRSASGYTLPFTQVYARPTISSDDTKPVTPTDPTDPTKPTTPTEPTTPATPANPTVKELPSSYSAPMKWRTSEDTGSGKVGEMNTYVQAITQVGDTVFVGGDYKNVVSASGEVVDQPFLSGYNVDTGELVRTFTPKFNNQIKALEALPNGKLVVGGEFTEVNGQPYKNLVVLDPVTGEINDPGWRVENRGTNGVAQVKTFDVQGDYLYVGGNFTHVTGLAAKSAVYSKNATRFNLKTNDVDRQWRPEFNGTVNGINAAEDGNSVFAAGYFSTLKGESTFKLAALNTTDGSRLAPWDWKPSVAVGTRGGFQFDVQDAGNTVWTGGTEHLIAQYDKNDNYKRLNSAITLPGGDFQDLHKSGNVIYGACHCGDKVYQGADKYFGAASQTKEVYNISLVGAWDATTGAYLPEFSPRLRGNRGNGIWESFVDSRGNLWVGGDLNKSLSVNGAQDTVGFARYLKKK